MKRIHSIDITRGFVMIIMALDHVRDYMHVNSLTQNPTDLNTTSPALFFTRWITHLCAPTFVFLAGTSAYLLFRKNNDIITSRKFLFSRGTWLILLELTIMNFAFWFDMKFRTMIFEVIGAIGVGFIILALLLKLSIRAIGIIGLSIIALHGLFPLVPIANSPLLSKLSFLFLPGATPVTSQFVFVMGYPPIPWLGIMLTGFAAGKFFENDAARRKQIFFKIGVMALLLFVVIRFINIYGDTIPWSSQKSIGYTFLSFINITKYPPSLLFCLVTMGITCLLLAFFEDKNSKITRIMKVFGGVPLFYFIVHFYFVHLLTLAMVLLQGYHWNDMVFDNFRFGRPTWKSGFSLSLIYLIWFFVVVCMYPLCHWYGSFKINHPEKKWLRYL